jgi:hypothetical protein
VTLLEGEKHCYQLLQGMIRTPYFPVCFRVRAVRPRGGRYCHSENTLLIPVVTASTIPGVSGEESLIDRISVRAIDAGNYSVSSLEKATDKRLS